MLLRGFGTLFCGLTLALRPAMAVAQTASPSGSKPDAKPPAVEPDAEFFRRLNQDHDEHLRLVRAQQEAFRARESRVVDEVEALKNAVPPDAPEWTRDWAGFYLWQDGRNWVRVAVAPTAGVVLDTMVFEGSDPEFNHASIVGSSPLSIQLDLAVPRFHNTFLDRTIHFVRWGSRQCLIPEAKMREFLYTFNQGGRDRSRMRWFPYKVSQHQVPDAFPDNAVLVGSPQVPAAYRAWIIREPLELRVLSIAPIPGVRKERTWGPVGERRATKLRAGEHQSPQPGMEIPLPTGRIVIQAVRGTECDAEFIRDDLLGEAPHKGDSWKFPGLSREDDIEDDRRVREALQQRRNLLDSDLQNREAFDLQRFPWAAEWSGRYLSQPAAHDEASLSPRSGFTYSSSVGCLGPFVGAYADIAEAFPGGITLREMVVSGDPVLNRLPVRWYFVRWGPRRYLAREQDLCTLAWSYNLGSAQPKDPPSLLVLQGTDAGPAPTVRPELPAAFAKWIIEKPLSLRVTAIESPKPAAQPAAQPAAKPSPIITLEGGEDQGLSIGMEIPLPRGLLIIQTVQDSASAGVFVTLDPVSDAPRVGDRLVFPGPRP